jgi:hypothetical protein
MHLQLVSTADISFSSCPRYGRLRGLPRLVNDLLTAITAFETELSSTN